MDGIHYDKIADKLINFHSKLSEDIDLEMPSAKLHVQNLKRLIDLMLKSIDDMAKMDERGWIR